MGTSSRDRYVFEICFFSFLCFTKNLYDSYDYSQPFRVPCIIIYCIENILSSTEGLSVNVGRFYLLVWCFWFIGRVTSSILIQSIKDSFASDPVPDIVLFHSATIVLLLFF